MEGGKLAAVFVPIGSLVPWDQNPRHNEAAVDEVAASIVRFGFAAPIIARSSDRMVIAGHTRLKAAIKLGLTEVPVRFLDLSEAESKALALADNKLGELAEWDDALLSEILADFNTGDVSTMGLGFSLDELDRLTVPPEIATEEPIDLVPTRPDSETAEAPSRNTVLPTLVFRKYVLPMSEAEAEILTEKLLKWRAERGTLHGFAAAMVRGC